MLLGSPTEHMVIALFPVLLVIVIIVGVYLLTRASASS